MADSKPQKNERGCDLFMPSVVTRMEISVSQHPKEFKMDLCRFKIFVLLLEVLLGGDHSFYSTHYKMQLDVFMHINNIT